MKPVYHFLDIDFNVKDSWRDVVDPDSPERMVYLDEGCRYLTRETKQFFSGLGLQCIHGYIWSWPKEHFPLEKHYYHTDRPTGIAQTAINFLLWGDPGKTEWIYPHRARPARDGDVQASKYGYSYTAFEHDESDASASLDPGRVMLTRIDVPHRVRCEDTKITRVSYSLRLKKDIEKLSLKWRHAVEILHPFFDE